MMFQFRLRAAVSFCVALGLIVCFISGGKGQQRFYHRCRQDFDSFLLYFSFPMFSFFFHRWGEGKKKGGGEGGVTWHL